MTTSQDSILYEILSGGATPLSGDVIPDDILAYFRERLKGRVYSWIVGEFIRQQCLNPTLTQRDIARRINKRPEQINRWLSGPSNMTLDTTSDLILGIGGGEPVLGIAPLAVPAERAAEVRTDATASEAASQRSSIELAEIGGESKSQGVNSLRYDTALRRQGAMNDNEVMRAVTQRVLT
jgi:transcriptional regulator with XRE-family HTH domain